MNYFATFLNFLTSLNNQLNEMISMAGSWAYVFAGFMIFSESGLFLAPFVPGDSLLFLTGIICSRGELYVFLSMPILYLAAVLGDNVNFMYGKLLSPKFFHNPKARFFKPIYIEKTKTFFEKHGKTAIIVARFIPVARIFAPLVAGMAGMPHRWFMRYNAIGCFVWTNLFLFAGFFSGKIPFLKDHFSSVIIAFSLIPFVSWTIGYFLHKKFKLHE